MKRKLLFAALVATSALGMRAQTDVTSTYLTNADFSQGTPVTVGVCTYAKDKTNNGTSYANLVDVEGWTAVNSADGKAGGLFAIGGGAWLGGSGFTAPATDSDGNTGVNVLGVVTCWGASVQYTQELKEALPAGTYTLVLAAYNSGAGANAVTANLIGFVEDGGTTHYATTTVYSSNTWKYEFITFTLEESASGKVSIGYTGAGSSSNLPHLFVSGLTLFNGEVDAEAYEAAKALVRKKGEWGVAVEAAETAKTNCPNVTGEELTALNAELAKAEPTTVDGYTEAITALEAATATLTAAKAAYDAYAEIRSVAVALGVTPGDAPANAAAAPAATHALNVAVYNATTAENIFDVTNVYAPSWSDMSTTMGQHWSGNTSIAYADNWSGSANTTTRTATITLPAGSYILMSAGRGSANTVPTMSANSTTVTFASNGDTGYGIDLTGAANFTEAADTYANSNAGRGWEWRYIPVTLAEETAVTVTQTLTRLSGGAWGSFSDFKILKVGVVATTADYTALNNAISTAEAKTLGFEDGEYAPYNNVAALTALATAKAINQTATNDQETVQAATTALTGATWTANDGDVDAIYNGLFATVTEGGNYPDGWTRTNGWGQMRSEIEGDYATAYYNQPGSLVYGGTGFYTMPLAENQAYKLTFSYRSHENNSNNSMTVSVLNAEDGMPAVEFTGNGSTSTWKTIEAKFTTGAAGNYVLTLANSGNTWMTNVSLVKVASAAITIDEDVDYTPAETYADVTLSRTIKAGINTLVLPFDMTQSEVEAKFGTGSKVYVLGSYDAEKDNVTFTETEGVTANTPCLLKAVNAGSSYSLTGRLIKTGETTASVTGVQLVGSYAASTTIPTDGKSYVVSGGNLYLVDSTVTNKGTRAYFQLTGGTSAKSRVLALSFDDETTGIATVGADGVKVETGIIYNLNGQRVAAPSKGIYIVNGKKVLFK